MSKLIVLNAPKGAGKTVLTQRIIEELGGQYDVIESRCKDRLFDMTMELFQIDPQTFWEVYNDRDDKETPNQLFPLTRSAYNTLCRTLGVTSLPHGNSRIGVTVSLRHAMIYVSECVAKPAFGDNYFGVCRAETLWFSDSDTIYVDDSALGTMDEIKPAMDVLGAENVVFLRIFGRGDFADDSRKYFDDKDLPEGSVVIDLDNSGDEEEFLTNAMAKIWEVV